MADQIMIMSLKPQGDTKTKALRPDWKCGLLMSVHVGKLQNIQADFLAVNSKFATRNFVIRARQAGKEVFVWTVIVLLTGIVFCSWTTTTVAQSPTQLPKPDPAFDGKIGETYQESTPSFPQPLKAAEGSPNVLLILLDDVGFGMCSTFGGPVETPNMTKLAKNGLTFNRFHTTALCSPTRAALLAGRNHHSVGTGVIIEMGTGFPGYTGIIPKETALISQVLRDNGYATSMLGKWHNTPETDISPAGPFDRWPTGLGFDYFYGFNQGEAHHFYPTLYRNTVPVTAPKTPEQGYHLTEDLTDEAIAWVGNTRAADRTKPWFCYFSTGAAHAPHHVPRDWIGRYKGRFDHGWDRQREITHGKQLEMGIIPSGTKLTPRPDELQAWDEVPADAKRVYLKLMENCAEFMAHTDHEVGRLIDSLDASGELDNTLVMYVVGDNGASAEGGLEGTFSELASLGLGDGRAVQLDQAGRQPLRWHSQPIGHPLASWHQSERRSARSVSSRDRRSADHFGSVQDSDAFRSERDQTEADRRGQPAV